MSLPTSITVAIAQRIAIAYPRLTVVQERKGDIDAKIAEATASLGDADHYAGICCVLEAPTMRPLQGEGHGGEMAMTFPISIFEKPIFNDDESTGSARDCLTWATDLLELLNGWQIGYLNYPNPPTLRIASRAGSPIASPDDDGTAYRIDLIVDAGLFAKARAGSVSCRVVDGQLMLSTNPSNGRIYYTTGIEWNAWPAIPGPDVEGATLYTEPLAISSDGMSLLAMSYGINDDTIPGDLVGFRSKPSDMLTDGDGEYIDDGEGNFISV